MRNYSSKLTLFLTAFVIGTVAAILFWHVRTLQNEFQPTASLVQVNEPFQPEVVQSYSQTSYLFNGEIRGCNDFLAYRSTEDKTKVIVVKVDKNALKLSWRPKTFQIENNKNIEVFIYDFGKYQYSNGGSGYWGLCFDAIVSGSEPIKLIASSGSATIYISKIDEYNSYNATITLDNLTFHNSDNNTFNLKKVDIKNVKVGWSPG